VNVKASDGVCVNLNGVAVPVALLGLKVPHASRGICRGSVYDCGGLRMELYTHDRLRVAAESSLLLLSVLVVNNRGFIDASGQNKVFLIDAGVNIKCENARGAGRVHRLRLSLVVLLNRSLRGEGSGDLTVCSGASKPMRNSVRQSTEEKKRLNELFTVVKNFCLKISGQARESALINIHSIT
jgi:hypothetical protein